MSTDLTSSQGTDTLGGPDPSSFDWQEAWYPVHYEPDLDRSKPNSFVLFDRNLVIWWDAGNWRVFEDICPHRLALLSEGRINDEGKLECPYHGWSFDGSGKCINIPQESKEGAAKNNNRACLKVFPAEVRQGIVFVYAGQSSNAATSKIPTLDALEENGQGWTIIDTFRDLPYDAVTALENVLDPSHVPFTHHGTIGNRDNAGPVNLEVQTFGRKGFQGVWQEGPRKGTLGTQYTTFLAPNLMWHELTSRQFGRTLTVVYVTPMSKGKCRLFARFPFQFNSKVPELFIKLTPRWFSHINQNRILEDDQIFLHYQERFVEKLGGSNQANKLFYLPTKADTYVLKLYQWINEYSIYPFDEKSLPALLDDENLLERYHSHTKNCQNCNNASKTIDIIRYLLLIIEGINIFILLFFKQSHSLSVFLEIILILIPIASWLYLTELRNSLWQGKRLPKRNISTK
jgi:phenylpropionate dioxygenase-like ring-hydroxylating dioxygenase large terminal subunit